MTNEINAGSMADIAFLLLIFFLVTTTIDIDKGLTVKLPPWSEEQVDPQKQKARNVFSVMVNKDNQLLVRGELADLRGLKERAKEFIINPQKREDLSEGSEFAVISLKNDRGTEYGTYLTVYNELKAAYNELWEDAAQAQFGKPYEGLEIAQQKVIREKIPLVISEAEPTKFGEEK
jgi:biopolymer transport protein ExbD